MKKILAATAFSISAILVGVTGEISLMPKAQAEQNIQAHQTHGVVKSVDEERGRVTLAHDPVPTLDWPSMTMAFAVSDKTLLKGLNSGQQVEFTFIKDESGKFVITQLTAL